MNSSTYGYAEDDEPEYLPNNFLGAIPRAADTFRPSQFFFEILVDISARFDVVYKAFHIAFQFHTSQDKSANHADCGA